MNRFSIWIMLGLVFAGGCASFSRPARSTGTSKSITGRRSPNGRWQIRQARQENKTITLFFKHTGDNKDTPLINNLRGIPFRTFWGTFKDRSLLVITDEYAPSLSRCHIYCPEKKQLVFRVDLNAESAFRKTSPKRYDELYTLPQALSPDGRKLLLYICGRISKTRKSLLYVVDSANRALLKTYPDSYAVPTQWWKK